MKALVIGASGLIGQALVRALERSGCEVVGTHQAHARPGTRALDVQDDEAVRSLVAAERPAVIFLAVNTPGGVDVCEEAPEAAETLHVHGTRHVARAAAACQARLVYYSTDYVFDGAAGPYTEEAPPHPLSVYGRVKLAAEQVVAAEVARHLIVRTTAVFGWDRASTNFAMQVWQRLQAGEALRVSSDQWGNPTLADYLAEVSLRLVQQGEQGIVHVVGKDRMSRADFARQLARTMMLGPHVVVGVPTAQLGQRAPRPLQGGLTTEKLQRLLGTEAMDLSEALKRFRRQWRAETHVTYPATSSAAATGQLKQEILDGVRRYYDAVHRPKPFVPFQTRIQYAGRVFGPEEMVNLVDSALDFWLTLGPYGELFEARMRRFFNANDCVLVNSGSTANLTAVLTLMSPQLPRPLVAGDEVLTPAVTFPTTVAPLVHSGLVPVFVDCEAGTYNINPHLVAEALTPKTRALVVPHTLGNPCDLALLGEVARRHELYLIEDCCDALGATFQGQLVGTFGELATLSFFPAHHITTGEGGAVVVNRPRLSRIARSVPDWGRDCWCAPGESNTCGKRFGWQLGDLPAGYDHKYTYTNLGYNFKPTDLQAAIGLAQAERIATFVEQRRRNFATLYHGLEEFQDHLLLPRWHPQAQPSWFGFPITVTNGLPRRQLVQWLESANIETREVFSGNLLRQPGYQQIPHRVHGSLEESDRVMRDAFFIGVYPGLTDDMLAFILERFRTFFREREAPTRLAVTATTPRR